LPGWRFSSFWNLAIHHWRRQSCVGVPWL